MVRINEQHQAGTSRNELQPKQESAALALASGANLDEAARQSGAGMSTIKTWMYTQPAFNQRVNDLRAEMTRQALGKLVENMTSAADTLGYLSRKSKSESIRLRASQAIIELGVKLRDSVELEARIAALEGNHVDQLRQSA